MFFKFSTNYYKENVCVLHDKIVIIYYVDIFVERGNNHRNIL